ncbi:MAG: HNH endonuclease signature motif containing protein [Acholeplasma sp.]|nr:HNH endonuclease signature motif containing protein [Acholeplasma sp.]
MTVDINNFEKEVECTYKNEKYSVRDNGAVLRHSKMGKNPRLNDNNWTFGKVNPNNGYLEISNERIHRIVATAFHGEPPTSQHIVDHIDTNRQNNRISNLRWITKLENALNNPITRRKIIILCGSIEAFLENPKILCEKSKEPNFKWMRTVTPQEAEACRSRLVEWAKSDEMPKGGKIGDWIFEPRQLKNNFHTEGATQRNWNTPSEFPCCPSVEEIEPLKKYSKKLLIGEVFSRNQFGENKVEKIAFSEQNSVIYVLTISESNPIKPLGLAKITFENNEYVHESLGTFFTSEGAEKEFTIAQGLEWTGGETFDDFA